MQQTNTKSISGMTIQQAKDEAVRQDGRYFSPSTTWQTLSDADEIDEQLIDKAILLYNSHQQVKTEQPTGEARPLEELKCDAEDIICNGLALYNPTGVRDVVDKIFRLMQEIPLPTQSAKSWNITEKDFEEIIKSSGTQFVETYSQRCFQLALKMVESSRITSGLNKEEIIKWIEDQIKSWNDTVSASTSAVVNTLKAVKQYILSLPSQQSVTTLVNNCDKKVEEIIKWIDEQSKISLKLNDAGIFSILQILKDYLLSLPSTQEKEETVEMPSEDDEAKLIDGLDDVMNDAIKMGKPSSLHKVRILKLVSQYKCKIKPPQPKH